MQTTEDHNLRVLHPEIGAMVTSHDPTTLYPKSRTRVDLRCPSGHVWTAQVRDLTSRGNGCPYCSGQRCAPERSVATLFPEVAATITSHDPNTLTASSHAAVTSVCAKGHVRTVQLWQLVRYFRCPSCFTFAVVRPQMAAMVTSHDPHKLSRSSRVRVALRCPEGHEWTAQVHNLTSGTGCPVCAHHGFNPSLPAYLYLLRAVQGTHLVFGITANWRKRSKNYERDRELVGLWYSEDGGAVASAERSLYALDRWKGSSRPGEVKESLVPSQAQAVHEICAQYHLTLRTQA